MGQGGSVQPHSHSLFQVFREGEIVRMCKENCEANTSNRQEKLKFSGTNGQMIFGVTTLFHSKFHLHKISISICCLLGPSCTFVDLPVRLLVLNDRQKLFPSDTELGVIIVRGPLRRANLTVLLFKHIMYNVYCIMHLNKNDGKRP